LKFLAVKQGVPGFRVLQGYEHLSAASLLQGGDGLVPGSANVAPALFVALHQAAARGDAGTCARLQVEVEDLGSLHTHGHWLPALKAACAAVGIGNGVPAAPLLPATEDQRRAITAILARHRLVSATSPAPGTGNTAPA
ncbi:MAG: dihydrodipicolinate synthase family protein, partial [candidate division NC10 bacterium]|nr:dihydrodipicolinate synthase family protein [candidate division NC10 bacterium]